MAKKQEINKSSIIEVEYNVNQICNKLHLSGNNRRIAVEKYQNQILTEADWLPVLRNMGLIK